MLRLTELPRFHFCGEGVEESLDLAACGPRIQAIADQVAARFEKDQCVGLVFPSGPALVLAWLGVLWSGRVPCILQYPTEKLSKEYWRASLAHTLETCNIAGLIHGIDLSGHMPERLAPCLLLDDVSREVPVRGEFPEAGRILQLSSGTTGQKKGVAFSFDALRAHAEAYNAALRSGPGDVIASWLPLYHDMGFVACFVMPLLMGIPVVMMDPIAWVRKPSRLFDAIEAHRGTVSFLPNFAFEVLSHHAEGRRFPSMRLWISCSEPAYVETMRRFQQATAAPSKSLAVCYAMAENVFAVTQSEGWEEVVHEGRSYLSCGRPIPGTDVKVVEDEIWVRSAHSLEAYAGGEDVRDAEGYYATGDLGFLKDGSLVVTGRKRDLLNLAGRKYMLNDFDLHLAKVFPGSAGRIASLARFDPAWGTERPLFLVEQERFWTFQMSPTLHQAIKDAVGLEVFDCHAVPPHFITKTSSGKINRRKTLEDWVAVEEAKEQSTNAVADIASDFEQLFGALPSDRPLSELLDSMGQVMLRMFCEDQGLPLSLRQDRKALLAQAPQATSKAEARTFSIVAMMDGIKLGPAEGSRLFSPEFIRQLEAAVGGPVRVEHLTVPPAPILWSDLVFHDYFMPRAAGPSYSAFATCMAKIKNASLLIVDDEDNFRLPELCVYPRLDHRFTPQPLSDFLAHRFMRYTQKHHLLPRQAVVGSEIQPDTINPALDAMEVHLATPIFRAAFHANFRSHTERWTYTDYRDYISDADYIANPVDTSAFQRALLSFVQQQGARLKRSVEEPSEALVMKDPPHFCSFLVNPETVQWVVHTFHSVCILGIPSSVPYLERALRMLGKPFFYSPTRVLEREDFECVVMTGASGFPQTEKPIVEMVHAMEACPRVRNVSPEVMRACPFAMLGVPESLKQLKPEYWDMIPIGNYFLNGGKATVSMDWMEPSTQPEAAS